MQETNRLSIGISPCPNDTFMFEALINKRVDTEGLVFDPVMEDVESLNNRSFREELDVSKLSFHALAFVLDKYSLLNAGSALGHKCGPLLRSGK
jgi:1,4-dihydroxy-6-naphthoate synthase